MKLTLRARRSLTGAAFSAPFVVGFLLFLAVPFAQSIWFSFNELKVTADGYKLAWKGLENYRTLILVDANFRRIFAEGMLKILVIIPLVLLFSFFAAALLNQKFRGRFLARIIFFLPVVISAEIALKVENAQYMQQAMDLARQGIFDLSMMADALSRLKLPGGFVQFIVKVVNQVPEIIRSSGIQILVFLAALQSIPDSFYEEARIEGATGWESFWRITFPILRALFLVNVVYTVIDSFTAPTNDIVTLIRSTTWNVSYGLSVAMSWLYFVAILAILGVTLLVTSRGVHYES
jgi:ABC-type sugar transport system permease subunit